MASRSERLYKPVPCGDTLKKGEETSMEGQDVNSSGGNCTG